MERKDINRHLYEGQLAARLTDSVNSDACVQAAILPYDASVGVFVTLPISVTELIWVAVDRGRYFKAKSNG